MSKTIKKFRKDRDYFDEGYSNSEYENKKQQRKRERKSKYFDEIETHGLYQRLDFKSHKFR
jgi:hypothetical protein